MAWHYRVVKYKSPNEPPKGESWLAIHSVYENIQGNLEYRNSYSAVVGGSTIKELRDILTGMLEALDQPILDLNITIKLEGRE